MFRPMRRFKQQLSDAECVRILKEEKRGVLSLHGEDGYPYGIPMDHWYCEEDGKIYFHGAKAGHKIDALAKDNRVSYCVYDAGFSREGEWALNISSVVVFGRISIVEDREKVLKMVRRLGLKYYPTEAEVEEELKKAGLNLPDGILTAEELAGALCPSN